MDSKGHPFNNVILGIAAIFLNILLLYISAQVIIGFEIISFISVLVATVVIGILEMVASSLIDTHKRSS